MQSVATPLFIRAKKVHIISAGAAVVTRSIQLSYYRHAQWMSNNLEVVNVPSYDNVFDWETLLNEASRDVEHLKGTGKVADYIPELAKIDPKQFGATMATVDGSVFSVGDSKTSFSIQSVSKVFSLMLAMTYVKDGLWAHVGREPSGNPFNSLIQLEHEAGIPRNPFINAGAIVVMDVLQKHCTTSCMLTRDPSMRRHIEGASHAVVELLRFLSGNPDICIDEAVAASEQHTGHRNYALAHFMASCGNIHNPVDVVLQEYFRQCAISLSCEDLAKAGLLLARQGKDSTGKQLLEAKLSKRIQAIMMTCGTYDAAGEIAYRIGLPCKSGVGGAVLTIFPRVGAVAVRSPGLDDFGNSVAGVAFLDRLTTRSGFSLF
jgi:glutaminase